MSNIEEHQIQTIQLRISPQIHMTDCKMSSRKPAKFQRFFWGGGDEGSAYYSRNLAVGTWSLFDPLKYVLTSAVGKFCISIAFVLGMTTCFVFFTSMLPIWDVREILYSVLVTRTCIQTRWYLTGGTRVMQ